MILRPNLFPKTGLILVMWFSLIQMSFAQNTQPDPLETKDVMAQNRWVDSIMSRMTVKDKIGQLFMVAAFSNKDSVHVQHIDSLIQYNKIGGLIFMQGTPYKQVVLNNRYQAESQVPLLIGFDGEWGLSMRLDSTYRYPWNLALGANFKDQLVEKMGKRMGEQCVRMGIHINFAPVVDINTNPLNPIIGNRSFGSDKLNVTEKALAITRGLQSQNVLACAKHFPGHGETDQDSHKTLPLVSLDSARILEVELYPYRKLISENLGSVMTAHLNVPAFEQRDSIPASLSKSIITDLLIQKMNFKGLIFTDALNMKGAAQFVKPGRLELEAFLAGNDILLFSENAATAIDTIYNAYNRNEFDNIRLDASVRKILKAKYWAGLHHFKPIRTENLYSDLNTTEDVLLHRALVDQSITLIKNEAIFPIQNVAQKIGYLSLGNANGNAFYETLRKYAPVQKIDTSQLEQLQTFDLIIIGYHKSNDHPWKNFQLNLKELELINQIAKEHKVLLSVFASPYSLLKIDDFSQLEGIVIGYQNSEIAQEITAQKIFGALPTNGTLPVSLKDEFPYGMGLQTQSLGRLSYGIPEEVGINAKNLEKIDQAAQRIISQKMAPGMEILVARHGKVIYQKSFGYFTYDSLQPVKNEVLYDLASVTKITAALPMIMHAYDAQEYGLDDPLVKLFPAFKGTNKEPLLVKDVLSHTAKLQAWIPFYKSTLDSITKKPLPQYYSKIKTNTYSVSVADSLYTLTSIQDTIFKQIIQSDLIKKREYKYSDLFFTLYKDYVQRTYKQPLDVMVDSLFYKSLGAYSLTYNPLNKFNKDQIAPTEQDNYFRYQLLTRICT
jgi:beta-N-acetylhexosaminidase